MADYREYLVPKINKFDLGLFISVFALICIGVISIFSATYGGTNSGNVSKQIIAASIGLISMLAITYTPERLLRLAAYPSYGLSILLLVLVVLVGDEINGSKGWIRLGGFNFQPAEFAKLGTLFALASFGSGKGVDVRNIRDLGISALLSILPVYLIMKQPDFGSASVILFMYLGVLFWAGFETFVLYVIFMLPILVIFSLKSQMLFVIFLVVASVAVLFFRKKIIWSAIVIGLFISAGFAAPKVYENLASHQKKRIEVFLNPDSDPRGAGYNVIQSKLAVGSGGVLGEGYLQGSQTQLKYVPYQWTDFIFSVPAEEFGFIGATLIVLLYMNLLRRSIKTAFEADSKFLSLLSAGAIFIFFYHILINIGMVIGLMPVMGIPLPFMSYGGTSMIFNLTLIGILLNAYRQKRIRKI
ncbi:rod shape-determining protein RodA [Candidatus Kapabacteria bacterium]|nr:rod shape-determining protein RodA [Candidatus Kapabacteria bacterium]